MSRSRGRRYDETPKLNLKKVFATIIAIIVIIMIIVSLKNLFTNTDNTKDVSSLTTYISVYENNKWGIIDNKGNIIVDCNHDEMVVVPDKNKALFICIENPNYSNDTYTTKVINEKGEEILTEYNMVQPLENTDGVTSWYESNVLKFEKDGKYGLINFEGKIIVPFITHGGGGQYSIAKEMGELAKGSKVLKSFAVYEDGGADAQAKIDEWLKEIK